MQKLHVLDSNERLDNVRLLPQTAPMPTLTECHIIFAGESLCDERSRFATFFVVVRIYLQPRTRSAKTEFPIGVFK